MCILLCTIPLYLHACVADAMADPLVRPPPETVDDMEDLTGETEEINSPAATADGGDSAAMMHVSSADQAKVHLDHCLPHCTTSVNVNICLLVLVVPLQPSSYQLTARSSLHTPAH